MLAAPGEHSSHQADENISPFSARWSKGIVQERAAGAAREGPWTPVPQPAILASARVKTPRSTRGLLLTLQAFTEESEHGR